MKAQIKMAKQYKLMRALHWIDYVLEKHQEEFVDAEWAIKYIKNVMSDVLGREYK
jgi:hypothetical protein